MFGISAAAAIGIGTIGGAVIGGIASNKAAKTQANAANNATDLSQAQYEQNRTDAQPWREAGTTALGQMSTGTAAGGEFNRDFSLADFNADPGYAFRQEQGQRGVENSAAARGGLLNGGTLKALDRYNQDYASGEYQNAYNRFNNDKTQRFNRLASLANTGQVAQRDVANQGTQNAQYAGNNSMQAANARASGYVGMANSVNQGATTLGNWWQQNNMLNNLGGYGGSSTNFDPYGNLGGANTAGDYSDIRLKTAITKVGERQDGLAVYEFTYVWGGPRRTGLMAQEVQALYPDAVSSDADGFLMVHYARA